MSYQLNAVSSALQVHPRTILRLTTGQPNPYWAEGYDPDLDIVLVAAILATTPAAIDALMKSEDSALTVEECAKFFKIKPAEFYRKNIAPDWQVGRVKRYSLLRVSSMVAK